MRIENGMKDQFIEVGHGKLWQGRVWWGVVWYGKAFLNIWEAGWKIKQ